MKFSKLSKPLRGEISVPGDKSISHRAVMFGAISKGLISDTLKVGYHLERGGYLPQVARDRLLL